MKENGIPKTWKQIPIGEVCRLINGRAFKPSEWKKAGLPIVRIQNLNDNTKPFNYFEGALSENHLIDNGDVLLSWSGTPGTSFGCFHWNGGKAVLNQHIFKVIVDEELCEKEYFIFAVNNILDEMIAQAHGGVGLRHITKGKLEKLTIAVAPLKEQSHLVELIKKCLAQVEEIKQLREKSRKEAEALTTSKVIELLDNSWQEKEVGEICFGEPSNGIFKKRKDFGEGVLLANVKDLYHDDVLNPIFFERVKATSKEISKHELNSGDVLVNRSSLKREGLGRSCVFEGHEEPVVFECHIMKIRINEKILHPYLFTVFMNSPLGLRQILDRAKTSTMTTWNQSDLRSVRVPIPPIEVQAEAVKAILEIKETSKKLIDTFAESTNAIKSLPNSILRKAFAGEL